MEPGFDDSGWAIGAGGFGAPGTPGSVVRTEWRTPDIWIRRTFALDRDSIEGLHLLLHHDEDAEVYINGVIAAQARGYQTRYIVQPISPEAQRALRVGENTLAIHCRQSRGGQYIDAGLCYLR